MNNQIIIHLRTITIIHKKSRKFLASVRPLCYASHMTNNLRTYDVVFSGRLFVDALNEDDATERFMLLAEQFGIGDVEISDIEKKSYLK